MFVVVAKSKDKGVTISFHTFKIKEDAEKHARALKSLRNVTAEVVEG